MGVLARVALVPPLVCYAMAVVAAGVVTGLAGLSASSGAPDGADLAQSLGVGVPLWLAAHLVPLDVLGMPLGVLPLAPALALCVLVAAVARTAARRLGGGPTTAGAPVVATAAAAHAVVGVLAAALLTPETVIDASPGWAGVRAGLLAGGAAALGAAGPCGARTAWSRVPSWVRHGARAGLLAVAVLLCAGAGLVLAALAAHAPAVAGVLASTAPHAGDGAGLTLLSAVYLPNAVVAATSWLTGPGVTLGLAAAAPTAVTALPDGALPPVPLLAVLPTNPPPSWAVLAFAVPLAVGSAIGWWLTPTSPDPYTRLRSLLVAGTVAALLLGVLAALAGGRAGRGPVDPVDVPTLALAAAVLAWVLVPGAVVTVLAAPAGVPATGRARSGRAATGRDRAAARTARRDGAGRGETPGTSGDADGTDPPDRTEGPDGTDGTDGTDRPDGPDAMDATDPDPTGDPGTGENPEGEPRGTAGETVPTSDEAGSSSRGHPD